MLRVPEKSECAHSTPSPEGQPLGQPFPLSQGRPLSQGQPFIYDLRLKTSVLVVLRNLLVFTNAFRQFFDNRIHFAVGQHSVNPIANLQCLGEPDNASICVQRN